MNRLGVITYRYLWLLLLLCLPMCAQAQYSYDQAMRYGYINLHYHNYDLAQHFFRNALKARPESATPYVYMAIAKYDLQDYDGAECDADSALVRNEYLQLAHLLRGASRIVLGKDSLALADLDYMLAHDPYNPDAMRFRTIGLARLDRHDDAIAQATTLLRIRPDNADVYAMRAQSYLQLADTTAALADIDTAINISPVHVNAHLIRCDVLSKRQLWEEACLDMDEVIKQNPYEYRLYLNRAVIHYYNDNFRDAMKDLNEAISLRPDVPEAYFNRALLRYDIKDLQGAADDFTAVLGLQPDNYKALMNRALVYMDDGLYKEALQDMNVLVQRYPRFYPVYYMMAEANLHLGNRQGYYSNVRKAEDMIRNYVDNPKKYSLDRPVVAESETSKDVDELTEEEVVERYNRLVTASAAENVRIDFSNGGTAAVSEQNVAVVPEPRFVISPVADMMAQPAYFKSLNDINVALRSHLPVKVAASPNERVHLPYPGLYFVSQMQSEVLEDEEYDNAVKLLGYYMKQDGAAELKIYRAALDLAADNCRDALIALENIPESSPSLPIALLLRAEGRLRLFGRQYPLQPDDEIERNLYDKEKREVYALALADLDKAISLDSTAAGAWYNKGCAYFEIGDLSSALNSFSYAIDKQPEFAAAYYNRALTYMRQGKSAEAIADLRKAGSLGLLRAYTVLKRFR